MYNTDFPTRAELPTRAQLRRSTFIALASACAILVTIVLPSEYAVDPLGVGRMLGLTEMGEIKTQLAAEAKEDAEKATAASGTAQAATSDAVLQRLDRIEAMLASQKTEMAAAQATDDITTAMVQTEGRLPVEDQPLAAVDEPVTVPEKEVAAIPEEQPASGRSDEMSFVLTPGEGAEVKMVMQEGDQAQFYWTANGGKVNYDTHGDGGGNSVSYEKGRSVADQEGVLQAAFTGNHGWFWRNRGNDDVTVTVRTQGEYAELKRMK
jgi:hypothetical protein